MNGNMRQNEQGSQMILYEANVVYGTVFVRLEASLAFYEYRFNVLPFDKIILRHQPTL